MHSYGWFMLIYGRSHHNIVKQFSPIKNKYFFLMGKKPWITFLKKRYTNSQPVMKKYSIWLITREMQINTTVITTSHPLECMLQEQQQQKKNTQIVASVVKDMEKLEPLCIVAGNVRWYSQWGRQYDSSLKKLKIELLFVDI